MNDATKTSTETSIEHPVNRWIQISKILSILKWTTLLLSLCNIFLGFLVIYQSTQNPLIITLNENRKDYYYPIRKEVSLTKEDLQLFITQFIKYRYEGTLTDWSDMTKKLAPFVTENVLEKIQNSVSVNQGGTTATDNKDQKMTGNKFISQKVIINEIKIIGSRKRLMVNLDRIVNIEGLKMVAPLQVEFSLIKASPSPLNPIGVIINDFTEIE